MGLSKRKSRLLVISEVDTLFLGAALVACQRNRAFLV